MALSLILSLLFFATSRCVSGVSVNVSDTCANGAIEKIDLPSCKREPCSIINGQSTPIQVTYKANTNSSVLYLGVHYFAEKLTSFQDIANDSSVCADNRLAPNGCPTEPGMTYTISSNLRFNGTETDQTSDVLLYIVSLTNSTVDGINCGKFKLRFQPKPGLGQGQ